MANLRKSNAHKRVLLRLLREEGRPTYARLLDEFDIYITDDPEVVAYMRTDKAVIVLNGELSLEQVSTIVRHEILHEYLTHAKRLKAFHNKGNDQYGTPDYELSNIAADFEISNRGYTEKDKGISRALYLGKNPDNTERIVSGLVTEDQRPGWEKLSYEEMYEKLLQERKQAQSQAKQYLKQKDDDDDSDGSGPDNGDPSGSGKSSSKIDPNSQLGRLIRRASKLNKRDSDEDLDRAIADATKAQKELNDLNKKDNQGSDGDKDNSDQTFNDAAEADKSSKADSAPDFVGETEEEARARAEKELQDKIARIEEILNDPSFEASLAREDKRIIDQEKAEIKSAEERNRRLQPLRQFKLNLQKFIADQVAEIEELSYKKFNPTYEDGDFIMPNMYDFERENIPKINVYHDVSGSFSDPAKTATAMQAIDTVKYYEKKGQLVMNKYYFADRVSTTREGAGLGTEGQPILDHIKQTKPTNVIIITDSDINDCVDTVKVPGAVWMLFYDSDSSNLKAHLKGMRQTKHYIITKE